MNSQLSISQFLYANKQEIITNTKEIMQYLRYQTQRTPLPLSPPLSNKNQSNKGWKGGRSTSLVQEPRKRTMIARSTSKILILIKNSQNSKKNKLGKTLSLSLLISNYMMIAPNIFQ